MNGQRALLRLAISLLSIVTCSSAAVAAAAAAPSPQRPNVIFILADDMGVGELGCYGQEKIKTPNLDRMAAEGVRFTQAYCGTSVCAPSRCALMTGQHIGHAHIRANRELKPEGQEPLLPGTFTVAHLFKSAGYKTAAFGKWGLGFVESTGAPDKMGFDLFFGYNCQMQAHEYYPDHLWRNREKVALDGKTYSHDLIVKEALTWLRENGKSSPFFLYLPVTIPHPNYQVPDLGPYANETWPENMKKYASMITRLDGDVGRLMALLKELGIDENTLVFYTSDNGAGNPAVIKLFNSNAGLRGAKRSMYEGALREPSLARWPGRIKPGTTNDTQWAFYDFLPTMAELIGATVPTNATIDGISVLPALSGQTVKRDFLYFELHEGPFVQGVRTGDWKGVRNGLGLPIEVYDLAKDPLEKTNLAAEQPEIAKKLAAVMDREHVENPLWPDKQVRRNAAGAKGGAKGQNRANATKGQ